MASLSRTIKITRIFGVLALVTGTLAVLARGAGATPAQCRVVNVTTTQVYNGTGLNLQTAIDKAAGGTSLKVQGLCIGTFTIGKDLTLIGTTTTTYPVVATLDGNAAGVVLVVSAGSVDLKNLRITHGSRPGPGGGIDNAGSLTLNGSSSVTGNTATEGPGGGIWNDHGTLTLMGSSSVAGNTAIYGGGIYNSSGNVILEDASTVAGNTSFFAGGIQNDGGTLTLRDSSSVTGNTGPSGGGGGIVNAQGDVVLRDSSTVAGNTGGSGGGIANDGTLTLRDSSAITGNTAGDGGGILNAGTLALRGSSTVAGNTAGIGGGIRNVGTITLNDSSSVTGNTATRGGGGGVWNFQPRPVRVRVTLTLKGSSFVTGNTATGGPGGGVFNDNGLLVLKGSSFVTGNTSSSVGGGIYDTAGRVKACTTWTGVISPNDPDDPPTPTPIAC